MWFAQCKTVADTKGLYRKLAKEHHPDHGGLCAVMQAINAEYHDRLARLNGETVIDDTGREHVYRYQREVEQAIMDKINELLALKLAGVEIELIGFWVWIHGDTRPVKDKLKAAGCLWHSKREMWYWRQVKSHYSGVGFDTLRRVYGSRMFESATADSMAVAA